MPKGRREAAFCMTAGTGAPAAILPDCRGMCRAAIN